MYTKGLLGYLPANILQGVIGFATLMVFTRILTPAQYGDYALAFGMSSLCQTLFFTWIEASMARFYPAESRDDITAPKLYGTLYRSFIVVAVVFGLLSALGLWLWPGSGPLKLAIAMGLGSVVFRSLAKLVQEQRKSEGRVGPASLIDMLQTVGGFAIGVACAWGGLGGGSPVLGAGLIAALCLPLFVREDWTRAARGTFDSSRLKQYAHYGIPVSASLILTLALYTADRFLIAHYLSEAQAGAYHAGFSLASRILDVLFVWFGAAGGPAMVHALENGGLPTLRDQARQQIRTMAFVLFPAVGGLVMVAPSFGQFLIGQDLRDQAIAVAPLISLGALFSGLNTYYFLQAFTLAKKTRLLVVAMAIPAVSNIVLNVALIPVMGLNGAAIASCLSFGLGLVGSWLLGLKTLPLPLALPDLLKTAACVAIMMAVVALIPAWGGVPELIAKSASGAIVYGALALVLDLNGVRAIAGRLRNRFTARAAT